MSQPNSFVDRRSGDGASASIASLKALLWDRIAAADGQALAEWSSALSTLEQLERKLSVISSAEREVRPRGLAAAPGKPFVALVGLDRPSGLPADLNGQGLNAAIATLGERIRGVGDHVHLGRVNRSSIEFTFFAENARAAENLLTALQRDLERPVEVEGVTVSFHAVLGFAGRDAEDEDVDALLDRAEYALAKARVSRVKVGAFTESDRTDRFERLSLMRELRAAVEADELLVFYQPKLNLKSSTVASMEALVRWPHPERGFVPPDQFIPQAEETGEIGAVTDLVLRNAIEHSDRLRAAGHDIRIDINISGVLVADPAFAEAALARVRGREDRLGFEITETAVIANPEQALEHIKAFSAAGIAIAIDDYGSGLSSLYYLKQIPADELKIDKAFVSGLTTSHRDPLLVRSTIDLAHALDMAVTAEGVDNPMSLALLRVMGCDMVQGYQIAKPLAFDALLTFLDEFDPKAVAPVGIAARR